MGTLKDDLEQIMNISASLSSAFLLRFADIPVLGYRVVMARPTASKGQAREIVRGSGNVFADLGFPDAEERQTKLRLAHALNAIMDAQRLTQAAAAARLGLNQPKVSALRNYKLEGFSVERLMTLLNALDRDVEIVIRAKPRSRATARISVVAA
jgi:predicted XRE-type DNA-binding protein